MKDLFFDDLTRDEVCAAIANEQGRKYGYTDKDWAWANEFHNNKQMLDGYLLRWCEANL